MGKVIFKIMRVILVIVCLLFMLLGLATVALSLFVKLSPMMAGVMKDQIGVYLNIALYIMIGIGAFMAVLGFIGCFGAYRKSTICLGIYITILAIIIAAEIAIGVFIAIKAAQAMNAIDTGIDNYVKEYRDTGKSNGLDLVQNLFKCCGGKDYNDLRKGTSFPASCCAGLDETKPCTWRRMKNRPGCKKAYRQLISSSGLPILIGIVAGIAGVEILMIAFAIAICCHSRRDDAGYVSVVT